MARMPQCRIVLHGVAEADRATALSPLMSRVRIVTCLGRHDLHHIPVFFIRARSSVGKLGPTEVLELGAVKPDAITAIIEDGNHLFRQLYISHDIQDLDTIHGGLAGMLPARTGP